jgi:hypothetical protein
LFYGIKPPPRISEDLLRSAISYRLQERAFGGLKPSTRRLLRRISEDTSALVIGHADPQDLSRCGSLPEWQGSTHQVTVLEDGVLFRGKRHRSLSEVL